VEIQPEPSGHDHAGHDHGPDRGADVQRLKLGLVLLVSFMVAEIVVGVAAHSLALLSDAAHMLTDAFALAVSLVAARLAMRPARGAMTFGLGRAEILSAQANALTMLVLAALILFGAIDHLLHPLRVHAWPVLVVALIGVVVNLALVRVLGGHNHGLGHDSHHDHDHDHDHATHSLNISGSLTHIATDLFGFIVTAIAAGVILLSGFDRADAIVSVLISGVMVFGGWPLLRASVRVMMEAAPEGVDPVQIGNRLAAYPGVTEIHDLHIWEVTSGFPTISAHIVVAAGHDCHQVRADLAQMLEHEFNIPHSTLQAEHAPRPQAPLQIEIADHA
jgi:cobalt-zinc-cadmium efflux system protein